MNNKITIKLISMEDIIKSGCFDISAMIEIIKHALISYKNGKILLPDKISQVFNESTQDRINCMPAALIDEKICGVKWVSVFPNNPVFHDCPNVSGAMILSEINTGFPFAFMEAGFLTALRTACMGACASKYLARKNSEVIGIIGSGEQAKMHLKAIKHVHPEIKSCRVSSRNKKHTRKFIEIMSSEFPDIDFVDCESDYESAVEFADIIVTAVSCQLPLLKARAIKHGAFYCHAGGYEDEYEVSLMADKIVCDNWEAVKHRTQTLSRLYKMGKINDENIYADLADIVDGTKNGRENDDEFIYFNSVGLAFIDVAAAKNFYDKVVSAGLGRDWDMKNSAVV